ALATALKKKQRHRDIAIGESATLSIGSIGTKFYRAGRAIHKKRTGTKGESRSAAADTLLEYRNSSDKQAADVANKIIQVLAKRNFDDLLKDSIMESFRS